MRKYNSKQKNQRTLHVISQSGYKYQEVPAIILKGKWLRDFGFYPSVPISITCTTGKLTITTILK